MSRILVVDDDPLSLEATSRILERANHTVIVARDGEEALKLLETVTPDLLLTDVRMPTMGGLELLSRVSNQGRSLPVILMTAFGRVEEAVWAMKYGAVDFLIKPFNRTTLLSTVDLALKRRRSSRSTDSVAHDGEILGASLPMQKLREQIAQVAMTDATVLIRGESGTGKELVARRIHQLSSRNAREWVALNCAAVPESLMEAELFGVEKGAYSGAEQSRKGLLETAHGGTLFLDEIGDLSLSLQAKLLRVLQEHEVRPLGGTQNRKAEFRLLSATHRPLVEMVKRGEFREDLYFRLDVVTLDVPPLRDRPGDVELLGKTLTQRLALRHGSAFGWEKIPAVVLDLLVRYAWPGNVRELANAVERWVVFQPEPDQWTEVLPPELVEKLALVPDPDLGEARGVSADRIATESLPDSLSVAIPVGVPLRQVEDLLIRKTLEAYEGDRLKTAKALGIHARTITRWLERNSF